MKNLTFAFLILFLSIQLSAQDFQVPKDYKFETPDDYAKYKADIIKGVNWLIDTPMGKDENKRREVYKFMMMWLTGSPSVSIEISNEIITFMDCEDCVMIFMGGWSKYALENDYSKDMVKGNLAGIESVITFYEKNKKYLGKSKAVQKYIKIKNKGKLEKHIKSKM